MATFTTLTFATVVYSVLQEVGPAPVHSKVA